MNQASIDFDYIKTTAWWNWVLGEIERKTDAALQRLIKASDFTQMQHEKGRYEALKNLLLIITDPQNCFKEEE